MMQHSRFLLLLMVLCVMGPIQLSQAGSKQEANERPTGYILYLNNLYHMIDTKYQNEARGLKLRALQKSIEDVRQRTEAVGYTESNRTLHLMECTVLDEVIETAGWRDRIRGQVDHWVNGCDLLSGRYTFYHPDTTVNTVAVADLLIK